MGFKDEYTTQILVDKEKVEVKPETILEKGKKLEAEKIIVTSDAYVIGQMLECLINKMVK